MWFEVLGMVGCVVGVMAILLNFKKYIVENYQKQWLETKMKKSLRSIVKVIKKTLNSKQVCGIEAFPKED
jgi:hypothetical protein